MSLPRIVPFAGVLIAVLMVGCGSPAPTAPTPPAAPTFPATSLSIKQLTNSYAIGDMVQLSATGAAADGTTKDLTTAVSWQSMDLSVATISSAGVVTAVGIGLADFRATYQTVTASGRIAVDQPGCTYRVSLTKGSFAIVGGSGFVNVVTQAGCRWSVSPDSSWMKVSYTCVQADPQHCTLTGDPTGATGSGSFSYDVSLYSVPFGTDARTGNVMVRWNTPTLGQNVAVTQTSECSVGFSPATVSIGADGGSVHVFVLAEPVFTGPWAVTGADSWITVTFPAIGVVQHGDGDIHFTVSPNTSSSPRVGKVVGCGRAQTTVTQAGR